MSIDAFRQSFFGVRSNRFLVQGMIPTTLGLPESEGGSGQITEQSDFEVYVKAVQIPGGVLGYVPLYWRGRAVKFSAERTYGEWAMQVYSSSFKASDIRRQLLEWMESHNNYQHTIMNYDINNKNPVNWIIKYNDFSTSNYRQTVNNYRYGVKLFNVLPVEVGPLEMNNDVTDAFAEFTVTLTYDGAEHIFT